MLTAEQQEAFKSAAKLLRTEYHECLSGRDSARYRARELAGRGQIVAAVVASHEADEQGARADGLHRGVTQLTMVADRCGMDLPL